MIISVADLAKLRRRAAADPAMVPIRYVKAQINQALQVGLEDWYTIARSTTPTESITASIDNANGALGAGALSPGWTNAEKKVLESVWLPWKADNL